MALKDIFVRLKLNWKEFEQGIDGANKKTKSFGDSIGKVGKTIMSVFAVSAVLNWGKAAFNTIKEFDSALKNLQTITGLSSSAVNKLGEDAIKLGKRYGESGKTVVDAMTLIGSKKPELLKNAEALKTVTDATLALSKAAKMDLSQAADVLTKSMNQYGAASNEASKYADILATSQQKGTATIASLGESFKNVGSVARASGVDFEKTNVLLQALAKGGLEGAEAGTKLRTIFLRLAKTGRADLNPATNDFSSILKVLSGEITDVTAAQEMFGEEAAAAALTLINQRGVVDELTGSLNVFGAANNQAATNMDTVEGSLSKLTTAWEGLILRLKGSTGFLKDAIDGLSTFLNVVSSDKLTALDKLSYLFGGTAISAKEWERVWNKMNDSMADSTGAKLGALSIEQLYKALNNANANFRKSVNEGNTEAARYYKTMEGQLQMEIDKRMAAAAVAKQEAAKTDEATKTTTGLIQALTDKLEKLQESYKAATTIGQLQNLTSQIETTKRELEDLISLSEKPMLDKAQAANAGLMTPLTGVGGGSMSDAITPGMVDASMIMPDNVTSLVDVTIEQFDFFTRQIETYADQLGNTFQVMGDYATDWSIVTNDALMSVAASNISMLGENLGAALNGEQFKIEEAGNALLASLGKFIVEYGSSMVALGIGMNIITPGSGVNKVVGGLALIAAGSVLTGYGNSRNGRGGGGGGAIGGKTESNADEFQITSSQPGRGGNAIEANNEIYGEVVVRGSDLVIALSNQQSKNNRI